MPAAEVQNEIRHLTSPMIDALGITSGYENTLALYKGAIRTNPAVKGATIVIDMIDAFDYMTDTLQSAELVPFFFGENKKKLQTAFDKEYLKYSHYVTISKGQLDHVFNIVSNLLSDLPFEKCAVQLTPTDSIKFTLGFKEGKILMISKPISEESANDKNIIFSLFVKDELIASNVSEIATFVEGFNKFLRM